MDAANPADTAGSVIAEGCARLAWLAKQALDRGDVEQAAVLLRRVRLAQAPVEARRVFVRAWLEAGRVRGA